ncbi:hypothetical protein BKA62DRAFT_168801 [Auriculariales sp. MPI-PUGE-AT-0066]|nr:hypothetical protein BKA62DRAFT_168801 [Auriculariales sp. MPI-PUGE-AT-0066]
MSSSRSKRRQKLQPEETPASKRPRNIDFCYLLLDPDYQPIAVNSFAPGDLDHLTVSFFKEYLSTRHGVSVYSVFCVSIVGCRLLGLIQCRSGKTSNWNGNHFVTTKTLTNTGARFWNQVGSDLLRTSLTKNEAEMPGFCDNQAQATTCLCTRHTRFLVHEYV